MADEEIIVLDAVEDSPVGPEYMCCMMIFLPFRSL